MKYGVKRMDALHLASALAAECERFLTTDKGILRHVSSLEGDESPGVRPRRPCLPEGLSLHCPLQSDSL